MLHLRCTILGSYPCFCGVQDKKFADRGLFNAEGKFHAIEERLQVLYQTDTWKKGIAKGNLAPFDTMKVLLELNQCAKYTVEMKIILLYIFCTADKYFVVMKEQHHIFTTFWVHNCFKDLNFSFRNSID